jgi:hypothetical protein
MDERDRVRVVTYRDWPEAGPSNGEYCALFMFVAGVIILAMVVEVILWSIEQLSSLLRRGNISKEKKLR